MNIQGVEFLEKHVEKLVLGVVGILCLWLLFSRVLVSPNKIAYRNRVVNPGVIDAKIREQADDLADKLNSTPSPKGNYDSKREAFAYLLDGRDSDNPDAWKVIAGMSREVADYSVAKLSSDPFPILPAWLPFVVADDRQYRIPRIGEITDLSAEHFRMAAWVPLAAVDGENEYRDSTSEVNDVDYITVSGKFNVAQLYKSFHSSFMGYDVNEAWRDPCYAKPVFSSVELLRQEVFPDGSSSEWTIVPRTRIDARREILRVVENASRLGPGGIGVRRLQLEEDKNLIVDLLQPDIYHVASADEQWFPPELRPRYVEYLKQVEKRERREVQEAEREARQQERETGNRYPSGGGAYSGSRRGGGTGGYARGAEGGYGYDNTGGRGGYGRGRPGDYGGRGSLGPGRLGGGMGPKKKRRTGPTNEEKKTLKELYDELEKIQLTEKTEISKMEDLVFWAHDDTVEPGRSYRYRMRIGVLNPVAGTGQVVEEDASLKNQVILWSEPSEMNEPLDVPKRMYFFANGIQEAAKKVTVKVSKYVKGYWYSRNFQIEAGEIIGGVVDHEAERVLEAERNGTDDVEVDENLELPETIDYSTGAVFVDVGTVNSRLVTRRHSEMLFSFDGVNINHMSVGYANWSSDVKAQFSDIEASEKRIHKPFQTFKASTSKQRIRIQIGGDTEEGGGDDDGRDAGEEEAWDRMFSGG